MAKKAQRPALVWTLRAFLLLNFCSALGFIIYALILENPPKTALPLGLLIVGCFSMFCVLIGLAGSLRIACCLSVYLVLGGALTLAELAITISMFFNVDKTVDTIWKQAKKDGSSESKATIRAQIEGGRWFFLVVCVLQFISVLVAIVLRLCIYPRESEFEAFEESGGEGGARPSEAQIQLNKLQASIGGRQTHGVSAHSPGTAAYSSSRLNKSTTQKMAAKYGDYTDEFNKKSWWRFGK